MPERLKGKLIIAAAAFCLLCAAVVLALYFQYREQLPPLAEAREQLLLILQSVPAPLYFLAFAILPAFGVPLTLFYLTALPVLGQQHQLQGILLAWLALALNMSLTKLLAQGILHPVIEWVIRHRELKIPRFQPDNEWKIVLATRLSPMPFALQNYILALGHSRWRNYLGLSMLIQGAIGLAVMLVGTSILSGGLGYVLIALCAFLVLNLLFDFIRKRLNRDRSPAIQ